MIELFAGEHCLILLTRKSVFCSLKTKFSTVKGCNLCQLFIYKQTYTKKWPPTRTWSRCDFSQRDKVARRPMSFLSLILYHMPGLAPPMNVLFWEPDDFAVSYSNRDTSWNAWNRHSGSFMVDTGSLFSTMKSPSHEC